MSTGQEKPYLELQFSEKSSKGVSGECERKTSLGILKTVDTNFHHILKLFSNENREKIDAKHDQIIEWLTITMRFQGACIVKVIRDEVDFLAHNRKSFPDYFVDQNVSTYQYWEESFSLVGTKPVTASATSYVLATLESFMLFMEFYWSVDSVLKTWPIPIGYSFPKVSDELDLFFERIELPPHVAYSLVYRPNLTSREMKTVIVGEYQKASAYLSKHLESVRGALSLLNLNESNGTLLGKVEASMRRMFRPIEDKLKEYTWKTGEIEKCDYRMNLLQYERVYASQQILNSYDYLKTLNEDLQAKITTYLANFYLSVKKKLSENRAIIRALWGRETAFEEQNMKNLIMNMLTKWEDTLEDVINLNRNGILEVITNINVLQTEIERYILSKNVDNISIPCF